MEQIHHSIDCGQVRAPSIGKGRLFQIGRVEGSKDSFLEFEAMEFLL
jgi:hypothetical protein